MHRRHFSFPIGLFLLLFLIFSGQESSRAAEKFVSLGPFGGDVRSLLLDVQKPDTVYLGTSSGRIFKSLDGGGNWQPLLPGIAQGTYVIDTLVQHPMEPDHIYAGAWDLRSDGGGLYESRDGGLHWSRLALPQPVTAVRGLAICRRKPEYMIAGTLAGPCISADGGRTWRRVGGSDLQKAESVAIDPVDPRILYVGTWRLGYKSMDSGKTWALVDNGMPLDSDVFSISIDQKNSSILYASACSGVYRSSNQARAWSRLRLLPDRFAIRAQIVTIDPTNSERVYTGTTEGLFVSHNNGLHWARLTSGSVTVNAIQINPKNGQNILIGTEYQGILSSEDGGRTWMESNTGFIHNQISWIRPDLYSTGKIDLGLASGTGGIYSYKPDSRLWTHSQILPGMRILSYLNLPGKRGRLAGTTQGIFWQARDSGPWTKLKGSVGKRTIFSLELDPQKPVLYAGTDQGIYRASIDTMDFRLPPGYRLSPQAWCIIASPKGDVVYSGTSLGLLRSYDRGTIWNAISSYGLPSRTRIESIAVSPSDPNHLFAGTSVGLFESRNGGIHWRRMEDDQLTVRIPSVLFVEASGARIIAADGERGGIFYSRDGGKSWDKINVEPLSAITSLAIDPSNASSILVGTLTDGLYQLNLP